MTFRLKDLGSYRIERSEEYISSGSDSSYSEMIRVRGSKPKPPYFTVPSHLYKYSESELGLYLHERKNLWRPLGEILNEDIDISDSEVILSFPIWKFKEIARIIPFIKKRGNGKQSDAFKDARKQTQFRKKDGGIIEQKEPGTVMKDTNRAITLETLGGGN